MNREQRLWAKLRARRQQYYDKRYVCIPPPPSMGEWYHAVQYIDRYGHWLDELPIVKICKTCTNVVDDEAYTQCPHCIACYASIEDHEAGEAILDRVLAGSCQNCGKKEDCTCVYVASTPDNPLRTVIGFQNA